MKITELIEKHAQKVCFHVSEKSVTRSGLPYNEFHVRDRFKEFAIELLESVKPKEPDLKHEECLDLKEGFIDGTRSAQRTIDKALEELRK